MNFIRSVLFEIQKDTHLIQTPHYYGQFVFSLGKESPYFFKWDDDFSDYVDLEEGCYLNDKDKVLVLQEFSLSGPPSTPVAEVSDG